jgi:hypothetical protein
MQRVAAFGQRIWNTGFALVRRCGKIQSRHPLLNGDRDMRVEDIDWSQLPQSQWTIQDSLGFQIHDTVAGLNRHLERIRRMEQTVQEEIEDLRRKWEAAPNEVATAYGYDPVTDEEVWACVIERDTYALLAVAISARVDKWYFDLCDNRGLNCRSKKGKTNLDLARKSLQIAGIECEKLTGFDSYERASLLGNKFKHYDGIADAEYASKYGVQEGEPIEYENQDWPALIEGVAHFLKNLCEQFRG